jgi:4-hydroxy-2-oxoheptanedioate aldolase
MSGTTIKKRDFLAASLGAGIGLAATAAVAQEGQAGNGGVRAGTRTPGPRPVNSSVQPSSVDLNYKPRRVNKVIELWEDGQPAYFLDSGLTPSIDPYAQGVRMARTWADAINVEMEHNPLDFVGLCEFMRGLVDGGPTRSGHRTPAVFVETCIIGLDEAYMRANSWVIEQLLDCGIHGIHICHARDTKAIQVASQMAMRYPFLDRPGVTNLPMRGLRGSSANYAANIWGINGGKYCHVADLWPLNPKGELMFGVKIEDTFADADAAQTLALPGVTWAEWGPGDHAYWLYGLSAIPEDGSRPSDNVEYRPEMYKIRTNVRDLCKKNNVKFQWGGSPDPKDPGYVLTALDFGTMMFEGNEPGAIIGREHTKRRMPV